MTLTRGARFYTLFFLEAFSRGRQKLQDTLYSAFKAGQLPVPVQPVDRTEFYRRIQEKILQSGPFVDTRTLVSTHHCFTLLVHYLRLTLAPDNSPSHSQSDSFISMMLSTSGLGRVVEYFAAEKGEGNNQRAMRKEFMRRMQADWDASRNDVAALKVYGGGEESIRPPLVREIWLERARRELKARGAIPHRSEDDSVVVLWEGARINIGCSLCEEAVGWPACPW
jgi:hypothetical protein